MSILEKLNSIKDTIPHYWPIGSFIHHNPLKGFEHYNFKEGLEKAKSIFGGKVYMEPAYYLKLYEEGKINPTILEQNLKEVLKTDGLADYYDLAQKCLLEVNPKWNSFRSTASTKEHPIDEELLNYLDEEFFYHDKEKWMRKLTKYMTLYEVNDMLFDRDDKEMIEKEIIEYTARFLDEKQTTLAMPNRELGMFGAFKLYENLEYQGDAQSFVEETLEKLHVPEDNIERYLLTHILKLHGWAGFIKYRSNDPDYYAQQEHPSSLIEYLAIRLYYELKYLKKRKINHFKALEHYVENHSAYVILKIVKYKGCLPGKFIDEMEDNPNYDEILENYTQYELQLDAKQVHLANDHLNNTDIPLKQLAKIMETLREEEGYVWLKSLEDSYIHSYLEEFTYNVKEEESLASATFCLDVRSESIRRHIESCGPYETYGAGGFLGLPIAFVEFDKAHELFLSPAIIKPKNVVFEIPKESYETYSSKKGINKISKKVLSDLKNNPYTPYIMVEAIGWLFGINLFGKTFLPRKTDRLFSKLKPQKPKTTYTLDKLSSKEIEMYVNKLHTHIIKEVMVKSNSTEYTEEDIQAIRDYLILDKKLELELSTELIEKLKTQYKITKEDYIFQKEKLAMVGFTLEEKVSYLNNYLTMMGQVDKFPPFVILSGHGSLSDNNPFESALDCGACGGNLSVPNNRALCMIANDTEVRESLLKEKGINIPNHVKFMPAFHVTSTDEMKFYDTDILTPVEATKFIKIMHNFNKASQLSRMERAERLPYTNTQEDIMIKSMDWSEARPEWGLAGNMAVYAGPRSSIKHIKFDNRFFMNSYDWKVDNDNADILTRVFDGPLIVGEWINLEHYFSTVDNDIYGAGSKVYHNVVSKVGVYSGNYSDLKIGLPTQSVLLEGEAFHEPIRLLTFIEAPLAKVGKAVENSLAKEFILNEWIRPVVIDTEAKKVYMYEAGEFKVIKEL